MSKTADQEKPDVIADRAAWRTEKPRAKVGCALVMGVEMTDRERLEAILQVVIRYLPPDGTPIKEAMGEIIELVDSLPESGVRV